MKPQTALKSVIGLGIGILLAALVLALLMAPACPPKPPTPKVWADVCNAFPDTPGTAARVANDYCPATHPAQYVKGTEPTTVCTLHVKPEPPIPQCDIPVPDGYPPLIWEGALLGFPSTVLNDEFTQEGTVAYANAIAEDGTNCVRGFGFFLDDVYKDGNPYWISWKPADAEYQAVVRERLKLFADRKITVIFSLEPYGGMATDSELDWEIETALPYLPYVIFETANENGNMTLQRALIARLKAHGVPNENIQLYYHDSGDFADALQNELGGKGLACLHGVGTMDSVNAPWPRGWSTSPGTLALMGLGLYGSNDGEDGEHAAKGLYWFWMPTGPGQRSTASQGHDVTAWFVSHGRGWEFLSAAGFQEGGRPNLLKAVELGREERKAMRAAYNETIY